jgi:hypothetical protein
MSGTTIEHLEGRVLLSDGTAPALRSVRVLGQPGLATGIALTFSEPMDAARAADVDAYDVRGTWRDSFSDFGRRRLDLASATYDDATRTVTLAAEAPFDPGRYLRVVRVDADAVTDASGTKLDGDDNGNGGDDAVWFFRSPRRGRTIRYLDATRSRVTLRLDGPGRLRLFQRLEGRALAFDSGGFDFSVVRWGEGLQVWVEGATPDSVLTGTVRARRGSGAATTSLVEIVNPGNARLDLLSNPSFHVTG